MDKLFYKSQQINIFISFIIYLIICCVIFVPKVYAVKLDKNTPSESMSKEERKTVEFVKQQIEGILAGVEKEYENNIQEINQHFDGILERDLKNNGGKSCKDLNKEKQEAIDVVLAYKEEQCKKIKANMLKLLEMTPVTEKQADSKSMQEKSKKSEAKPSVHSKTKAPNMKDKMALSTVRVEGNAIGTLKMHTAIRLKQRVKDVHAFADMTTNIIESRLDRGIGVSAGDDEDIDKSLWVKVFYGRNNDKNQIQQGALNRLQKVKGNLYGISVGNDHQLIEDLTVGLAVTYVRANSESRLNDQISETDRLKLYMGTFYTHYMLSPDFSLSGNLSVARYRFEVNKDKQSNTLLPAIIEGDFMQAMVKSDYNIYFNKYVTLLPNASLSFNYFNMQNSGNNIFVRLSKLKPKQLVISGGLKAKSSFQWQNIQFLPSINVNYGYVFHGDDAQFSIIDAATNIVLHEKIDSHYIFKIATHLNIPINIGEFTIGFEHNRRSTHQANIACAKLKINF